MTRIGASMLLSTLALTHLPTALASTTRYVNGVSGSNTNNCASPATACKTIGYAIAQSAAGDVVMVAAATYTEHLTIGVNLSANGSGVGKTIIDGASAGTVVTVSTANSIVNISDVTIRNGRAINGGGIYNKGTLTINRSSISGNEALSEVFSAFGGGVLNSGRLTLNNSTVSGNTGFGRVDAWGGGITNFGTMAINESTVSGNTADCGTIPCHTGGGGINNGGGTLTINSSTIAGNEVLGIGVNEGGGILSSGALTVSNSTISGNSARAGGGIYGVAHLQNSIVADSRSGGNCSGSVSGIFSLSSDSSCSLRGPGDLNSTDPKLGTLGNYGGPTQTIPLLAGSPAIDAGNLSGCTDAQGRLLTTDQRGFPRPDKEDTGGCDMGAYERQGD